MSKEKRRVPKLRFPGFTEDWEQRKLSDITEIVMGQSPSSKNYTDNPNDNILVQGNADLKDGKVVPRLWTKEITKTIDKDGIILTVRAPVGDVAKTDYKVVLGRGVAGIKGNDYIYQFLQKLQNNRYWVSLSSGSTFESINSNDIKDLIIDIPSIEEQTKISMLLNNVNSIITLHQRKLEHLNLKKKALLQKLFPKNGERYPELRFPGFTDAWEQRKLGNLATVEMNKRIFKEQTTTKGDIPFYKIGTFGSDADSFISRELFEEYKNKYPYPNIGDILISASGSIGRTVVYNGEDAYYQDSNIVWLNHNGQIDNSFLLQFYNQVKWAGLEGSTIKRLYNKNILETNIALPKIEEQRLIGKFFKLVDSSITLHQRKLEHLQLQKKALLQQMFV